MTRGAIVVGASSGIGEALVRTLAERGYDVGLAARRTDRLNEIASEIPTTAHVATMDVTETDSARETFFALAERMGRVDLVVVSAGVGELNRSLEWEPASETVAVNVRGFTAIASAAMAYFETRAEAPTDGSNRRYDGHLVGISSVAARFGNPGAPTYNASKAYVSRYLEGLRTRQETRPTNVTITTVEPGFVDTEMAMGETLFWMSSPETAAAQIATAIEKRRSHVFVTRRWRLVAWLFEVLPEPIVRRLLT
ncbi:SDR family NAD(P)-dependent oxidoreductase [Halovivax gelatinilyticus]|uniref:SDR family NAD(P)-dependent oxidoreductase n=1 Tax=Halovivax gelatinilyticus TaxID=2961597 RepID=UPI0020CA92B5|nr:SDR family NAD(P)-dependent oxidoreductase [Halovivax gelatinilyticus]